MESQTINGIDEIQPKTSELQNYRNPSQFDESSVSDSETEDKHYEASFEVTQNEENGGEIDDLANKFASALGANLGLGSIQRKTLESDEETKPLESCMKKENSMVGKAKMGQGTEGFPISSAQYKLYRININDESLQESDSESKDESFVANDSEDGPRPEIQNGIEDLISKFGKVLVIKDIGTF